MFTVVNHWIMENINWKPYIEDFRNYLKLERSLSDHSIEAYINDVKKLAELPEILDSKKNPSEVGQRDIESLILCVHEMGLGEKSQGRILSGLRSFFKYLMLENMIDRSPMELIEGPKLSQKFPSVLSFEEIRAIIEAIDMSDQNGHRNRAIIETLYACGLRVTELVNLKLSNYFPDIEFVKVIGKNDKERIVPIGPEAIKQINYYIHEVRKHGKIASGYEDYIFLNRSGKNLTRVMIFTIIKRLVEAAGIHKTVSPHTFRHSFATHLVEGGANLRAVQDMLGHESITTTEIYAHMDTQFLRETILNFHPRNN